MATALNIAHRGGAGLWPENTLFAFAEAAEMGCDGAELDVQLTRDGKLAVFHDFRLNPVLCREKDGAWVKPPLPLIRDLSLAQLRKLDVGRFRPRTRYAREHRKVVPRDGEHIPSLSEVIACVRPVPGFRLFIEIKTSFGDRTLTASPARTAAAVVALLRQERFIKRSVLVGFDWPALIAAKTLEPKLACWFTTKRRRRRKHVEAPWAGGFDPWKFGGSIPKAIAAAGGDGWFASAAQANARNIAAAHELGLQFGVWTVNGARAMRKFIKVGAEAVCTDRPDRLSHALEQRRR